MKQTGIGLESKSSSISQHDYTDNLERELSQLKKRVTLNNSAMVECANDQDKFIQILKELSEEGIKRINSEEYEESLVYFEEAERILEYSASCGKTIDRNIIIAVLHNESCAFQRIYDLPKLSKYLEALIYNLGISIENSQVNNEQFMKAEQVYKKGTKQQEVLSTYIKRKLYNGRYHLLYCALNSKNFEHQTAIKVAQKSISIFKEVCNICHIYEQNKRQPTQIENQTAKLVPKNALGELAKVQATLTFANYEKYLRKTKKLLATRFTEQHSNTEEMNRIEELMGNFSIGKIMQIAPLSLSQAQQKLDLEEECSEIGKIRKALHIAAGFFSIGTELRLLSSKSQSRSDSYKSSDQFSLSEVYHLFSLLIVLQYVPCETIFLTHLLTSYNNHYSIQLEIKTKKTIVLSSQQSRAFKTETVYSEEEAEKEQREQVLEMLPEQSEIQMEGESRWSKSQIRSPSEDHMSDQKLASKNSRQCLSKKKKSKVGIEYRVSSKKEDEFHSNPNIQAQRAYDIKHHRKLKTENSTKKSSIHSTSRKKDPKNGDSSKNHRSPIEIKTSKGSPSKDKKSKSREKIGQSHNILISDMLSPKRSVQMARVLKGLKSKSRERKHSKQTGQSRDKKYSRQKQRKLTMTIKMNMNSNLGGQKNMFSPTHHRQFQKTLRKSKPKKSLETKRKLKKTIK